MNKKRYKSDIKCVKMKKMNVSNPKLMYKYLSLPGGQYNSPNAVHKDVSSQFLKEIGNCFVDYF